MWRRPAGTATLRVSDRKSLDVAVVIRAVGLGHVHLAHGVTHVVHPVPARRHALVDAVQALGLLEAGDLVLRGESSDGYGEKTHSGVRPKRSRCRFLAAGTPQLWRSSASDRFQPRTSAATRGVLF